MIIFGIVVALGAIFFIPLIDLSNNMNSLRPEYNNMTHKDLDSIYVNTNSNIFSVDTSFREPSCKLANVIDLNKVIDIELREDNDIVTKVSTASVVARGVVGGVVAGGIGTLVGGATAKSKSSNRLKEISIIFKLNDINNSYQEIIVAFNKNGISSEKQEEAYKLFSQLELLLNDMKK